MTRAGLAFTRWAERWFPDSYVFAALAVVVVAAGAMLNGAPVASVTRAFGNGFWSLITFMVQMAFVAIGGYVVATSPPAARLIERLARLPRSGRGAVAFIAAVSMLVSLANWGVSLILSGLLARAIARRGDIRMDYRAAGAAGYLGLGATWALGLSSAAAQLQANPASLPKALVEISGVIPFTSTIFLWQSGLLAGVLIVVSVAVAFLSAPGGAQAVTAQELGVALHRDVPPGPAARRPGEWLEHSPLITVLVCALGAGWLSQEFAGRNPILAISNLNTYNLFFLTLGLGLHWRPASFLRAVSEAVPATTGVLIQFPLYGSVAAIMTGAAGAGGHTLSDVLARLFMEVADARSFPVVVGLYSAVLGFFIPSGGGKWLLEAPYVMQAASQLRVHLGWTVQVYNTAEALPTLVNPFWMLPLLGVLGLRARDIVGFTFLQLVIHLPLVLFLLWLLAGTLAFVPPVRP